MRGKEDGLSGKAIKLRRIYRVLEDRFGDLKWWPADTKFEMIAGAILTQNTSWLNVEKAIASLKKEGLLTPHKVLGSDKRLLERSIRPAGYFHVKAERLKNVSRFLVAKKKALAKGFGGVNTASLREELLSVNGIGPETADSILLYAFKRPVFVVDAYAKRIFARHGLIKGEASYDSVQELVHDNFPMEQKPLNQFHALIVEAGKIFCRKTGPKCGTCPLKGY